jgi:hypothetical protein
MAHSGELYIIETREGHHETTDLKYRYRSLFNGAVGTWCATKEEAKLQGEAHQALIGEIYHLEEKS